MNFASRASRAPSLGSLSASRTSFISGVKPPHRASAFPELRVQSLHRALGNPFSWPKVNLGSCRFHNALRRGRHGSPHKWDDCTGNEPLVTPLQGSLRGFGDPCDKNVIVPCSESIVIDKNASGRASGKRLKNQVEWKIFIMRRNTLGDLQNRRAAGHPVTGGFDPHSLPPHQVLGRP
jgi:hypothetical protein